MRKYFDENGYFIADSLFADGEQPFIFVLGGRGTGKTFSATRWLCQNCSEEKKFIYMRRTESEMQFVNSGNIYEEHSPEIFLNSKGRKFACVDRATEGQDDETIGYHISLSMIHNIRGFSMLDVSYILFDEFIAERGTTKRAFQGEQMLNAYETINRNRELNGVPPVKCVFLSNFNTAESDIMTSFGYTDEIYKLQKADPIGIEQDEYKKLLMINESQISLKKERTVLYNASTSEEFKSMALHNDGSIFIMPIVHYGRNSYDFYGTLGEININRLHNANLYYLTKSNKPHGEPDRKELIKFNGVYSSYLLGNVYANSQYVAEKFLTYYR